MPEWHGTGDFATIREDTADVVRKERRGSLVGIACALFSLVVLAAVLAFA